MLKKIGIALAVVVVLLVGAVLLIPRLIDWNDYKSEIAAAVRDATGRDLVINGDIEVFVLPGARFIASDIRLANAEGAEPPHMATVDRIEGSVRLLPLIGGSLVVETLIVRDPTVVLQVDQEGRPNWEFAGEDRDTATSEADSSDGGAAFDDVRLDDVRIEGGVITYVDARTGQLVEARDISLSAALPSMAEPLSVTGSMTLNGEPVSLRAAVDTPAELQSGERAAVTVAIDSPHLKAGYEGGVQREPLPGLDGVFELDIPSAGELAAWLDRPLPEAQPDPGPVRMRAVFEADGEMVAIREASLKGEALEAQATGVLDISGEAPRLSLQVESGILDIDRYLPPAPDQPRQAVADTRPKHRERPDLLAGISDEPFDLSALRQGEADVRVSIGGIRAAGFEVGRVLFAAALDNGVLTADLEELSLYGGGATGNVRLDASQDVPTMSTDLRIRGVRTDDLGAALTGGESPVTGVVSADLQVEGRGGSPRDLAESLNGTVSVDLGGLDLADAAPGAISGLKVKLDLPGVERSPVLTGSMVYDQERVDFTATSDPLPVVLSADRFDLDAQVSSRPVRAAYKGAVLREPVSGLDGAFDLSVPSVARLAAWLGSPLGAGQPDPGPLQARAVFSGEGNRVAIQEAVIEGRDLRAEASGSWVQEAGVTRLALDVTAGMVDLDRYLPQSDGGGPGQASGASSDDLLASLPNEPLDLSALESLDAEVDLILDGLRVAGQELGRTAMTVEVEGRALTAEVRQLSIYGGSVQGRASLDGSGETPSYEVRLNAADVGLGRAMAGGAGNEASMEGSLSGSVEANGRGASPRALVAGTTAEVEGRVSQLVLPGETPRRAERLDFRASVPGFDQPIRANGDLVYGQETVTFSVELDPARTILDGDRFAADVTVDSAPLQARYEGAVQQRPVLGLDGRLAAETPAIGRLLAWLGQPLPSGQPEPGPLEVNAVLSADGAQVALKEASIHGKALQATATASYDGSGARPRIQAQVDVQKADLDAYLPASAGAGPNSGGQGGQSGWSTEPLDLAFLSSADGLVRIGLNAVRFRGLDVQSGDIRSELENRRLNAAIEQLQLAGGNLAGTAVVDGRGNAATVEYDMTVSGVQARPLLQALADTGRLSGQTEFRMNGSTRGGSQREMVSNLNGGGELSFLDGAIHGINLAALMRQVGSLGLQGGEEEKTDFAELGGSFTIRNGLLENRDLKMLAPLIRLAGGGTVNLPARTIDYRLEGRLVASLEGQGGEEALAGIPIPIIIEGTFENPRFQVDWATVLQAASQDPERLKALPGEVLGAAKEFGVNIENLRDSGAVGDLLKSLPGAAGIGGVPGEGQAAQPLDALRQLLGGNRGGSQPAGETPQHDQSPQSATEPTATTPSEPETPAQEAPEQPTQPEKPPQPAAAEPAAAPPEKAPAPAGEALTAPGEQPDRERPDEQAPAAASPARPAEAGPAAPPTVPAEGEQSQPSTSEAAGEQAAEPEAGKDGVAGETTRGEGTPAAGDPAAPAEPTPEQTPGGEPVRESPPEGATTAPSAEQELPPAEAEQAPR